MFNWWRRRFFRDGIFWYHDGRNWRPGDYIAIYRELIGSTDFDWESTPLLLKVPDGPTQTKALGDIARAVRKAFKLPAVERYGLSELECLELLGRFQDFSGFIKKNGSLFPISLTATDSASSEGSAEKPALDSGSTAAAPSFESPTSPAAATPG